MFTEDYLYTVDGQSRHPILPVVVLRGYCRSREQTYDTKIVTAARREWHSRPMTVLLLLLCLKTDLYILT